MVRLPEEYIPTWFEGYYWNKKSSKLYSLKSGILKELQCQVPNNYARYRTGVTGPYYQVSCNGRRQMMNVRKLKKLKSKDKVIPTIHK